MDFAQPHIRLESVASKSKVRLADVSSLLPPPQETDVLDEMLIESSNKAARDLLLAGLCDKNDRYVDASLFTERLTPRKETIQVGDLVVIMESFDKLNFVYVQTAGIYSNRNGHFHHADFLGKPFGSKIRSRNNRGYGFCFLMKPTPELWARSLNHRTQIVHELDQSQIIFQLYLRPNMTVVESGTGSGAMSHAILRTIAPAGHLHTYEFNQARAETAREEFASNGVGHLVTVHHKDACSTNGDGFGLTPASVDAAFLDLPEPWLAIPHAAVVLKANARIATYSPCVEQTQKTIEAMQAAGFHSIKTMEYRLQEHYVDEVEYEPPPCSKRPKFQKLEDRDATADAGSQPPPSNGLKEEADQLAVVDGDGESSQVQHDDKDKATAVESSSTAMEAEDEMQTDVVAPATESTLANDNSSGAPDSVTATTTSKGVDGGVSSTLPTKKKKKFVVARPFASMRGHTAFLTFATAGNRRPQPAPKSDEPKET